MPWEQEDVEVEVLSLQPEAGIQVILEVKLEKCGFCQSEFDLCLFIGDIVILVMYVYSMLMWSTKEDRIYVPGTRLCEEGVELEGDDYAPEFLGIKLTNNPVT